MKNRIVKKILRIIVINDRRCGGNRHILFLMEEGATGNNRL